MLGVITMQPRPPPKLVSSPQRPHRPIRSCRHKGLEALYKINSTKGVQAEHAPKLRRILSALDVATGPGDVDIPGFRTHRLKGRLSGHWSIWVTGNWRVAFRFVDSDVELVDYMDYH